MKSLQNGLLLAIIIGLVAYTLFDRLFRPGDNAIDSAEKYAFEAYNIDLPDEISFCDEKVPLKEPDIRERFDREMHANVFFHSNTLLVIKRANKWLPDIEKELKKHGLPEDLKYLVAVESAFTNAVSPKGATGFWQIMETTARDLGLTVNDEVDERYDPARSTEAACKYLKQAYQKFGSWTLVAASYNMGITGVENALKRQRVDSYYDLELNEQTARYVFRILAFKEIMENPEKYKFNIKKRNLYYADEHREVEVSQSIPNLIDFSIQQGVNLKLLRIYNPWLRSDRLTIDRDGTTYRIKIPLNPEEASLGGEISFLDSLR